MDDENENTDHLDVACDAWILGDATSLKRMGMHAPDQLVRLAQRLYDRGDEDGARERFREIRRKHPRVCLRGAARVLADRSRNNLRREACDVMQWNPRFIEVGASTSPSIMIRRLNETSAPHWRAWWTEEDALVTAQREAWRMVMEWSIDDMRITGERVSRRAVKAEAAQLVDRYVTMNNIGELLGCPGPLTTTISGFVLCQFYV